MQTLQQKVLNKLFGHLNEEQKKAVFTINGNVLILAGAGSGKTTVVVNRIAYMLTYGNSFFQNKKLTNEEEFVLKKALENEIPADDEQITQILRCPAPRPYNILAITFTNKAANELKERISKKLGEQNSQSIWCGTFHSICGRILRRFADKIGYTAAFTIYDTQDSQRAVKECMDYHKINKDQFDCKAILRGISRAKDRLLSPEQLLEESSENYFDEITAKIYKTYQSKLKQNNAMDFDDMILRTIELLEKNPDVLELYSKQFRFVMVDEFQDTNQAQYHLINLLSSGYQNLCVVGDDDQSIYKFRGAAITNILEFDRNHKNAVLIKLEENYRSTDSILNAANSVISKNLERKGKKLWTSKKNGDKIVWYNAADENDEAAYIVRTIEENVKNGGKYRDHTILFRLNSQSANIENHFVKAGLPHRLLSGIKFYDRKEIKDILAYLHVINNPCDSIRIVRIINEPKRKIGESTLELALEVANQDNRPLYHVISEANLYPELAKKYSVFREFCYIIDNLRQKMNELPLPELLEAVLDDSGYRKMLESQREEGQERLQNILELKSNMVRYQQTSETPTLCGFLEEISLVSDIDNYDESADACTLMTIHASKGLEFPNIFIIGMEEGIFPSGMSIYKQEELEEERRLAYVAITRAKNKLYITTAKKRMLYGKTNKNMISRFLSEIPKELLNNNDNEQQAKEQLQRLANELKGEPPQRQKLGISAVSTPTSSSASPKNTKYNIGDNVKHNVFGIGKIISIQPMGGDSLLEIVFENKGTKKLMANFANLTRM